jgi:hypothetical protein
VANWQGHGAGHGNAGIELLEFGSNGSIVWQWNKAAIISSLQGVLVLDSLNTNLLYDDRNGIMMPLENTEVKNTKSVSKLSNSSATLRKMVNVKSFDASHEFSGEVYNLLGRSIGQVANKKTETGSPTLGSGVLLHRIISGGECNEKK